MSGPKISKYELEQMMKKKIEEAAYERQRKLEAQMREKQRKAEAKLDKENLAFQKTIASVNQILEKEQQKQQERMNSQKQTKETATVRKSLLHDKEIKKTLDFETILEQARQNTDIVEECQADLEDIVRELVQEPMELHSLIDAYVPKKQETQAVLDKAGKTTDAEEKFDDLLLSMEEEYRELVSDRAFFKHYKEQILRFEEVCKRQQEYHSYQLLRDVYYGDFGRLKEERSKWHKQYDTWKEPFYEVYIQYRAACEMAGQIPEYYSLKLETVSTDIEELKQKTEALHQEYLRQQESMEVTRIFNEVMEEMGYQVLGTKDITKKTGAKVHNTVFSYGDGSGIHVMDSGERITMEIVGLENEGRSLEEEDKEYLTEEQEHFCDSFHEIEQELAKRGVVLKDRIGMLPPSKEYAAIMSMEGYERTKQGHQMKSLSGVDKKAVRKQQKKRYFNEQ